jgi:nucleotide-binding universal stress UspA family protein
MTTAAESRPKTLMIGFEPTPEGEDALALGTLLAEVLGAVPLVVRVFKRPPGVVDPSELETAMAVQAEAATARIPERLNALGPRTLAVAHDSTAGALSDIASDEDAIALVIGSGRGGVLGRVLPGSTGRALLHGAPCAVAVAPRGYSGSVPDRILRVGAGFDASAESLPALDVAISIASRCGARLDVVTVADFVSYGFASSWSVLSAGEFHDLELEAKQQILDQGLARVPADLPVEGRLMRGEAGPELVSASNELDLLVAGSRAYGPLRRVLLGSASTHLLHDARSPVLVLARGVDASSLLAPAAKAGVAGAAG